MTKIYAPDSPPRLWYFAYGSNLDPSTFLGRRKMQPHQTLVACLSDWNLCFDLPVGPGERGVGNVRRQPGACVWGVAYELDGAEASRLDATEGVPHGAYQRVAIRLNISAGDASDDASIEAFTYHSSRGVEGRKPSRRYLGLILTGARHHGLPPDYIDELRALPLAIDERESQLELPV